MTHQAQCPECMQWFDLEWQGLGWWWHDSSGCPGCGAIVLVESECSGFREVEDA